nr:transporter substrate-binding domain-containing protein [Alteromonas sp. C1M14]
MVCTISIGCQPNWEENKLSQIVKQNTLRVGIINGPQTYAIGPTGPVGFDYELVSAFGDYLDVTTRIHVYFDHAALQAALQDDDIDIAITGDAVPVQMPTHHQYGPVLYFVNQVLVTAKDAIDITSHTAITVVADSTNQSLLRQQDESNKANIAPSLTMDKREILQRLANNELSATVVDSNTLALMRTRYPQLTIRDVLAQHQKVAWRLHSNKDHSVLAALYEFISQYRASDEFAALESKYFDASAATSTTDMDAMVPQAHHRYQTLIDHFRPLASQLPWQLHAAVAYENDHWQSLDQQVSADLDTLAMTIPARIVGEDRLWMTLAAYFGGAPHLADARALTEQQRGDPDNWIDVKQRYINLSYKRFYRHAKAGVVQGDEVISKVENVGRYYDAMKVLSTPNEKE